MSSSVTVYFSSVSSSMDIKKAQQKMFMTLDGHKIAYNTVDVATQMGALKDMRALMGDDKALVPQIFNGDRHCGNYPQFLEAIEDEGGLYAFLDVAPPAEE
eukprot:m.357271 g.357271  ORF g.357271 m.357271 type:complete len:101 (+) comp17758_c0_seq1:368-670(+)